MELKLKNSVSKTARRSVYWGSSSWYTFLLVPYSFFSFLAIGMLRFNGSKWTFSENGPTRALRPALSRQMSLVHQEAHLSSVGQGLQIGTKALLKPYYSVINGVNVSRKTTCSLLIMCGCGRKMATGLDSGWVTSSLSSRNISTNHTTLCFFMLVFSSW